MAHHSSDRPWLCSECPKTYKTKIDLLQHQRVHDKAREPFSCDTCGQEFRTRSTFNTHQRTHLPKGPQKCELCDRVFKNIRSHQQMVHEGIRQHVCKLCEKTFGKRSGLARHIQTVHQKLRMWSCDLCEKSFGEKAQLQRHQKTHLASEPKATLITEDKQVFYKNKVRMRCGICQKIVNSSSSLRRHKMLVHENKKTILCDFCPRLFGERSNLKKHMIVHHPEEVELNSAKDPEDEESSIDKDMVKQHGFTETYPCPICKQVLLTNWGFKAHQEICVIRQQKKLNKLGELRQEEEVKQEEEAELKFEEFGKMEEVYLLDGEQAAVAIKQEPSSMNEEHLIEALDEVIVTEADVEHIEYEFLDDVEVFKQENIEVPEDFLVEALEVQTEAQLPTLPFAPPELIQCELCPQLFKKTRYLRSHMITVHGKKKYKCCIVGCSESFIYRSQRLRHLRRSHPEIYEETDEDMESQDESETQSVCELCNALVSSREDHECLKEETEEENDEEKEVESHRANSQSKPEKVFLTSLHFNNHDEEFLDEDGYKYDEISGEKSDSLFTDSRADRTCDICQKVFKKAKYMETHKEKEHQNETQHLCPVCNESFSFQQSMERHLRTVHRDKSDDQSDEKCRDKSERTCEICFKVFKKTKYMELHKASVHRPGNQYFCPICNREFSFQRSMERHIKAIHEDRKDFTCAAEGCEKAFRSRYEVNEHFNNIHAIFKKVPQIPIEERTCDVCEKVCSSRKVLYSHKKLVHEGVKWGIKFECKLCKENFESKYKKSKHWGQVHRNGKVKVRTCHVCNTDFQLFEDYKEHIMNDHEGSFICFICGKDFHDASSLFIHSESHRKVEEELRQYICDVCSHRLSTKAQLLIHMRNHFTGHYYMCDVSSLNTVRNLSKGIFMSLFNRFVESLTSSSHR